jgi:hypothetical protein
VLRSANGNRLDNFFLPPNYERGCLKNSRRHVLKPVLSKVCLIKKRIIDSLPSRNMHVIGPAFEFPGMSLHSSYEPMWISQYIIGKNWDNAAACMSLSSKVSRNCKPSVYTLLNRDILAHRRNVPVMVWRYGMSRQCCWTEPSWTAWGRPSSPKTPLRRSRSTRTPGTAGGTSTESTATSFEQKSSAVRVRYSTCAEESQVRNH